MISSNPHSVFNYCVMWDYNRFVSNLNSKRNLRARVCYVTTQTFRLYVVIDNGTICYVPCKNGENHWIPVRMLDRVKLPNTDDLLVNEESFKDIISKMFFFQFPTAEETFYKNYPKVDEVLAALTNHPYGSWLQNSFLISYRLEDKRIDDADGLFTIYVDEGRLMVPYSIINDDTEKPDYEIQVYRAKLHPDNKLAYIADKFCCKIEDCFGAVKSISWASFRRFVDKRI